MASSSVACRTISLLLVTYFLRQQTDYVTETRHLPFSLLWAILVRKSSWSRVLRCNHIKLRPHHTTLVDMSAYLQVYPIHCVLRIFPYMSMFGAKLRLRITWYISTLARWDKSGQECWYGLWKDGCQQSRESWIAKNPLGRRVQSLRHETLVIDLHRLHVHCSTYIWMMKGSLFSVPQLSSASWKLCNHNVEICLVQVL